MATRVQTNLEQLTELVTQGAALFYLVEEPHNPAVRTYWDALHYVATSLSVGYANIFPVTAAGKAIGAAIMMVGPALSARALDPLASGAQELPARADPELLGKLDEAISELRLLGAQLAER